MKKNQVKVGGRYYCKVGDKVSVVKINEENGRGGWNATNEATGRSIRIQSAQRLRGEAKRKNREAPKADLLRKVLEKRSVEQDAGLTVGGFPPTREQQEILRLAREGHPVIVIEAGAGTGKTATDVMLAQALPGRGQYTAFNRALVDESKPKFQGTGCACNTTHSLAFKAVGHRYAHRLGGGRIKSDRIAQMLEISPVTISLGKDSKGEEQQKVLSAGFCASLVMGAVRRFSQSAARQVEPNHFRYLDGIDLPENGKRTYANNELVRELLLPFAEKAWKDICDPEGQLPFSHDHYVKIWDLNDPVISADYILLDEAQDSAGVLLSILQQQVAPERTHKPMIILVGDSAQQIYEWRGAINALEFSPGAPRAMLSQSFRFGEVIAQVANQILESLEQLVRMRLRGFEKIQSRVAAIEEPTAILCRTNALAVATMLGKLAAGKNPFLVGGGSEVISFVEGAVALQAGQPTSHPDLCCFDAWNEVEEYSKSEDGEDLRLMVRLIDEFGAETILAGLKAMGTEEQADVVISTAHKSKGREWKSVKLGADFPAQEDSDDAARKLLYVAVTRAQALLDVSECPFFNGEGAMDISKAMAAQPKPVTEDLQEAAPTTSEPAPAKFTWSRGDNGSWLVRGPKGAEGKTVTVERKNGSTSQKHLRKLDHENGVHAWYIV